MRRRPPTVFFFLAALGLITFFLANTFMPRQHLAWRSLDLEAPTGMATKTQLFRVSLSKSETCMAMADAALDFSSSTADPKKGPEVCGWKIARDVLGSHNGLLKGEAVMQCPLALGTYIWTREIDGLARKYFKSPLKNIRHFGTYSCRRQNGNNSGRWSEHAYANAWDVAGFELEDGSYISVLNHWSKGNRKQRNFLRGVRSEACKIFRVTLGPDYNAAHKDHFHVDMGPTTACS